MRQRLALVALLLAATHFSFADMPMMRGTSPAQPRDLGMPVLRDAKSAAAVLVSLDAIQPFEVERLRRLNEVGGRFQNGVVRELATALSIRTPDVAIADAEWKWRGAVQVSGANGVRLQLTDLSLPEGTVFWVYGETGAAIGFDASLAHAGTLWTPTVYGESVTIEVRAPGAAAFTISAVADIRADHEVTPHGTECFRDAACHMTGSVANSATGIARYQYMSDGAAYVCTGGLIIDSGREFKPYFLTANHCISTASEASSVEAYWDYRALSCGGSIPSLSSRPRSNGASILVTSANTDVTLLRLSSVPGTRYWLGWSGATVPTGTALHRISNPGGGAQVYSTTTVDSTFAGCSGWPRPQTIYQQQVSGGTAGGSSGSPVLFGDGVIVGQLRGICGADLENDCNYANRTADGALAQSYPLLKPYIDAGTTTPCSACTPNSKTACLLNKRFKVEVSWKNAFVTPATSGTGDVVNFAENRPEVHPTFGPLTESTYFSFFAPGRVELVVKLLSGVTINDKFWVFAAGLTNNEYTIKVTDTTTCRTWQRTNAHGTFSNITDFEAFPFP